MALGQRGLGKGLSALIESSASPSSSDGITHLSMSEIIPNRQQPRKLFDEDSLKELASSIASQGVLQPILVRSPSIDSPGVYELIAGERRWRAAQLAGLTQIPVIVKTVSDNDCLTLAMIENLQREDLNPIDEALGLQALQVRLACNQETLAQAIGKSRPSVANAFRLLQLSADMQDDVRRGRLSAGHARALLSIDDEQARLLLRNRIVEEGLSVRESEALASYWRDHSCFPASEETAPSSKRSASRASSSNSELNDVETELTARLGLPIRMRGARNKGSLVISFRSEEEFQKILELLSPSL